MKYRITLEGKTYEVEVERCAPPARKTPQVHAPAAPVPAPAAPAAAAGVAVSAPLPGNVLAVNVAEGEAVHEGQVLLLVEAMKMENEIVAPCDGVVKSIAVQPGAVVATGDTLLVI